ncbi:Hsp70 family protein [Millisia brevis]|uniref:Hsp70 family protein n=1 Tax=Millisia brevis TaxID=264148 RepID=UPI00082E3D5A|nr:Hsp70 family protein [Millisia brevis]
MTTTVGLKVGSVTACAVVEASGGRTVTCRSSALRLSAAGGVDVTDAPDGLRIDFPELVPNPTPFGLPAGGTATVAELYAGAVRALLDRARRTGPAGPAHIVLAVPAHWDTTVIDRVTARCAERGVEDLHTVSEPVAAATWLRHFHGADEPVLVFDMGGHSLDVAVVGFDGRPRVLGTPLRSRSCTGDVLDDIVLRHVLAELGADPDLFDSTDPQDIERITRLRGACRSAREALSTDDHVVITDSAAIAAATGATAAVTDSATEASEASGPAPAITLTRDELNALITDSVRAAAEEAAAVIDTADVTVGTVLLTGGCADTPVVTDIVSTQLGLPVVCHPYPATTSAAGAALPSAEAARRAAVPAPRPAPGARAEAVPGPADSGSFDPDREAITETLQAVVVEATPKYTAYAEVDESAITEPTEPADPTVSEVPVRRERSRTLPLFGAAAAAAAVVVAVVGAVLVLDPSSDTGRVEADPPAVTEPVLPPAAPEPEPVVDVPIAIATETPPAPAPAPVAPVPAPASVEPPPAAPAEPTSEAPAATTTAAVPTTTAGTVADQSNRLVDGVLDSTNGIVNDVLEAVPGF